MSELKSESSQNKFIDQHANVIVGKSPSHGEKNDLIAHTCQIVSAYVANHDIATDDIADLISKTHQVLMDLQQKNKQDNQGMLTNHLKESITDDYLICLEDGKKLKMLKRHLRTNYQMTPQEYRAKWGLPSDYPMVAPSYAAKRSQYAKNFGLGRSPKH